MSLPKYAEYKDSSVDWLGKVPVHWQVTSLSRITSEKCDGPFGSGLKSTHYTDEGVRVVRLQNIRKTGFDGTDAAYIAEDYFRSELSGHDVREGDVLVAGLGDDRNTVGRACVAPAGIEPAMVKADCFRFRLIPNFALSGFVSLQLSAGSTRDAGVLSSGSTRSRISLSIMASRTIALPPIGEQRSIVAFLDRETAKIDALIAEQEKLLALLAEKRQAAISHAVTRGLDPNVPMKDSGIAWLGEVPAHWEVVRLASIFREVVEDGDEELPILSVSIHDGVSDRELGDADMDRKVTRSADRSKYKRVAPNDLTYNMMRAWQGAFGAVQVAGQVSPAYVVARPRGTVRSRFVECLLRTPGAIEQVRRFSRGITEFRLRLYWEEFKNLRLVLPPTTEQDAILATIETECLRFDALNTETQQAVELLRERRSALIAATVTGQIDVRAAA